MFRKSGLTTLMSSAVCALVATSAIGEAVFAQIPGQKRVIYKISDINQFDADSLCRGQYGNYTSARLDPQNDVVICGTRLSPTQTQTGGQAGVPSGVSVTLSGQRIAIIFLRFVKRSIRATVLGLAMEDILVTIATGHGRPNINNVSCLKG